MGKFLYLKLGFGNCLAKYWLNKEDEVKNVFNRPVATIYFGTLTVEECRKPKDEIKNLYENRHKKHTLDVKAIKEFIEAGDNVGNTEIETTFVTITGDTVYIYEPENRVQDMDEDKYGPYDKDLSKLSGEYPKLRGLIDRAKVRSDGGNRPKYMPVKIVKECTIKKVPHVLATLPCNQYYTRGTCREIDRNKYWGAIQAIKHCLKRQVETPKNQEQLMDLLSPYQLETLVFLILKEKGVFVDAWRGGTLKDINIFARNLGESPIEIPRVKTLGPGASLTFQVKKGKVKKVNEFHADWVIATGNKENKGIILGTEWLLEQIRTQPDTKKWFLNSLNWWVPSIESLINNIPYGFY